MGRTSTSAPVPAERIERAILLVRGEKVMLDEDLAALYDVSTGRLNEQVSRNLERFPEDFSFRPTPKELSALISQNAISKKAGRGGRRKLPRVFTEHGILMLSSVLRTDRAVQVKLRPDFNETTARPTAVDPPGRSAVRRDLSCPCPCPCPCPKGIGETSAKRLLATAGVCVRRGVSDRKIGHGQGHDEELVIVFQVSHTHGSRTDSCWWNRV